MSCSPHRLNIAHRGASGSRPENTLEAFGHALALGAHGVELDVRRCQSGELVVIHDATLVRTVAGKGRVSHKTLEEIQSLAVRGSDGRVPTLEQTLQALGKDAYCFIELKTTDAAVETAQLIERFVNHGWRKERLILITFHHQALTKARQAYPALTIGASFKRLTRRSLAKAQRIGASFITPYYKGIKERDVEAIHAAGLKLVVWTVNRPRTIARLMKMGVDGIMSDYPDRVVAYVP